MFIISTTAVILIQSIIVTGYCYIPAVAGIMLIRRITPRQWAGSFQLLIPYLVGTAVCVIAANMFLFRGHPDPNWPYSRSLGGLAAGIFASLTVYGIACFGAAWRGTAGMETRAKGSLYKRQ